jgi:hypothetical protein
MSLLKNMYDGVARAARDASWLSTLAPDLPGDQPAGDGVQTAIGRITDLAAQAITEFGIITDAIPLARTYRVQPDNGGAVIGCCLGMRGSGTPIGAYDGSTLVVGTHVRFVRNADAQTGVIIAVEPMYMWDPTKGLGDIISQGSNTGLKKETGPQVPFGMGGAQGGYNLCGGVIDWSGRTPFDSLEIGEFNHSTETGLMLHLDSYMAMMRVDEYTGVWMFYWDGLLRVAGQNFQEWAGPTEREVYDDEGESMYYHGIAPYPWEHQGMLAAPYAASTTLSADDSQNNYPYYGRVEPTDDDLQPFHRFREYAGYLGQGQKKLMCGPITTLGGGGTYADTLLYSDNYMAYGLHEQQITMAGHFGMRGALGMTFAKRPVIPVPKRIKHVTSQDGDKPADYKASDLYGDGPAHAVQPTPTLDAGTGDDEAAFYRATTVLDLHAHLFNWEGLHPFHYHSNDYYLPEEDDYDHVAANQEVPNWDDLNSQYQWYLDVPGTDDIVYDHRTGSTAKVYRNTSFITQTDEGGIIISDGWGAEIRMAGGDIQLHAPGDVCLMPGRNVIAWGGRDICLRAWNCVDITANEGSIFVKAEENVDVLAGNGGGPYGLFFETRGSGYDESCGEGKSYYSWDTVGEGARHTGIVFKAKNAEIVGWSRAMYFMTRMDDCLGQNSGQSGCGGEQLKEGDIVFDTKGKGDFITRALTNKHWTSCGVMFSYPHTDTSRVTHMFTEDGVVLGADTFIDGDLLNYGSHLVRNAVISTQDHFYSGSGSMVGKIDTSGPDGALDDGHNHEAALVSWSTARWAADLNDMWYVAGRPGNVDVVQSAWVSLRVEEDYKSQAYTLWEARWQQMVRENGDSVNQWAENCVESNRSSGDWQFTCPFPGKQRLIDDLAYRTVDNLLHDTTDDGRAVDRAGGTYEAPLTLNAPSATPIDGYYYHIGK